MRHFYIFLFITLFIKGYSQNRFAYTGRSDKKNEIQLLLKAMWAGEFYSYGVSYERSFYKIKNSPTKAYFSAKVDVINRIDIFERPFDISSSNNQLQTFIKYNFGYKNIIGTGLGVILVGEKFAPNPTAVISYKYVYPKKHLTLEFDYQASLNGRIPPFRGYSSLISSTFPPQKVNPVLSVLSNFCAGVSLGKYF